MFGKDNKHGVPIYVMSNPRVADSFFILYFITLQTIVRTRENVEKKQALTYEEMEAEREEVIHE